MTDTPTPPDGWYPDPAGGGGLRRWNGTSWTDEVRSVDGTTPTTAPPAEEASTDTDDIRSVAESTIDEDSSEPESLSEPPVTADSSAPLSPSEPPVAAESPAPLSPSEPPVAAESPADPESPAVPETPPHAESSVPDEPSVSATPSAAAESGAQTAANDSRAASVGPASEGSPAPAGAPGAPIAPAAAAGGAAAVAAAASAGAPPASSTGAPIPPTPAFRSAPAYPSAAASAASPGAAAFPGGSSAGAYPSAPPAGYDTASRRDVNTNTVWIWLLVVLPLVGVLSLFAFDWGSFIRESVYSEVAADPLATPSMAGTVLTAVSSVLSLVISAATVVFAFLDWRQLRARGIERPFHWAWSFFVLVIGSGLVYIIGRSVIVRRHTGKGLAPLWAAIGVTVVTWIIASIWLVMILTQVLSLVQELQYTYGY